MPRKPEIEPNDLEKELEKWPQIFDQSGSLLSESDPIWKKIKSSMKLTMSEKSLYLYVYKDRHSCRTNLQIHFKISQPLKESKNNVDEDYKPNQKKIKIHNPHHCQEFTCNVQVLKKKIIESEEKKLKKKGWTDELAAEIWSKTKLPCSYNFKSGWLTDDEFLFEGYCSDCKTYLNGKSQIDSGDTCNFIITTYATFKIKHSRKRKLKGERRVQVKKVLLTKTATQFREDELALMEESYESPNLNTSGTLNKAREQALDEELDFHKIKGLSISNSTFLSDCGVRKICLSPFYVWYWLDCQINLWNQLRNKQLPLSLDASGSLLKKYKFYSNAVSKTLFVYVLVIGFHGKIIPLAQMISSIHDVTIIREFLSNWLEYGALDPLEINTDGSLALQNGISLPFNNMTFKEYLLQCFKVLKKEAFDLPACYLGQDIAHLLHAVGTWKCFKVADPTVTDFYMRCIGYLIQVETVEEFEKVLVHIIIVAQSDSADVDSICYKSRVELIEMLKTYKSSLHELSGLTEKSYEHMNEENEQIEETDDKLKLFIDEIFHRTSSKCHASDQISDKQNFYQCPDFLSNLKKLCYTFPVWTNCMRSYYSSPNKVRSSARSETYFRIIKDRIPRPVLVQKYILKDKKKIIALTNFAFSKLSKKKTVPKKNITEKDIFLSLDLNTLDELDIQVQTLNLNTSSISEIDPLHTSSPVAATRIQVTSPSHSFSDINPCTSSFHSSVADLMMESLDAPISSLNNRINLPPTRLLIQNGLVLSMRKYKIAELEMELKFINTCPFDSIFELLTSATIANLTFEKEISNYIIQHRDSDASGILSAVVSYCRNVDREQFYEKRAQLLHHFYSSKTRSTKTIIACEDNIMGAFTMLLKDYPSICEYTVCLSCKHKVSRQHFSRSLSGHQFFVKGIKNLQGMLDRICCNKTVVCSKCHQKNAQLYQTINSYFLLELDYLHEKRNKQMLKEYLPDSHNFTTKFEEIPVTIMINNELFKLNGLVSFENDLDDSFETLQDEKDLDDSFETLQDEKEHERHLIHYKAYTLTSKLKWVLYNDLASSVQEFTKSPEDKIALILYTKA